MPLHYRQAFTVLFPEWLRTIAIHHGEDVKRYICSIFPDSTESDGNIINNGCDRLKAYFKNIGLPTSYSEYGRVPDDATLRNAAEQLAGDSALSVDELVGMFKACL